MSNKHKRLTFPDHILLTLTPAQATDVERLLVTAWQQGIDRPTSIDLPTTRQ